MEIIKSSKLILFVFTKDGRRLDRDLSNTVVGGALLILSDTNTEHCAGILSAISANGYSEIDPSLNSKRVYTHIPGGMIRRLMIRKVSSEQYEQINAGKLDPENSKDFE